MGSSFFEGCRPSFYFHGGKLVKDNKSGAHFWRLNLVLRCVNDQVIRCGDVISNNYLAIETRDNQVSEIGLDVTVYGQSLKFYALEDAGEAVFFTRPVDLESLRLTRVEEITELWFVCQLEQGEALHEFVRKHIFTRLWVEFEAEQSQLALGGAVEDAVDAFVGSLPEDATQMTITVADGEPIDITQAMAEQARKRLRVK